MTSIDLHIGGSVFELAQQAGIDLGQPLYRDNSPVVIEAPVRIRYSDRMHGFTLPPGRFVYVTQSAGVITGVLVSPVLEYTDLKTGHEATLGISDALKKAGWTELAAPPVDFGSVGRAFQAQPADVKMVYSYGTWQAGGTVADIYLKRDSTGPSHTQAEKRYLPNLDMNNAAVRQKVSREMYERRQRVRGSLDEPLPLSAWRKER